MTQKPMRWTETDFKPQDYLHRPYGRLVTPEEDGTFRAEIQEFPGCIATGDTEADALAALRDVTLSWLESAVSTGHTIPEPMETIGYSGKLVLRLPKSLHRKAALAANCDGVSLNQFIVSSVAEQVGLRALSSPPQQPSAQLVFFSGSFPLGAVVRPIQTSENWDRVASHENWKRVTSALTDSLEISPDGRARMTSPSTRTPKVSPARRARMTRVPRRSFA